MKKSKTLRTLALGFVLGAACMVTTSAIGASRTVSAIVNDNLFFNINGDLSAATAEQPILNYNGWTYVPIRFVAEKLDCEVNWDPVKKCVTVRSAEPEKEYIEVEKIVEVEKPVYVTDEYEGENKVYKKLPTSYKTNEYEVEVLGITRKTTDDHTKVHVNITSDRQEAIQLVQKESVLTVDGKEYPISNLTAWWDNTWYQDIKDGDEVEGFILFDLIDEDWSNASLELTLRLSDYNGTYEYKTVTINFKR